MSSPAEFYTPERIIRNAMEDAGLLEEGTDPNSDQFSKYSDKLNDIINMTMARPGMKLWTLLDQPVTLTTGKATYTLMPGGDISLPRPGKIETAYFVDQFGSRRQLDPMSWEDWVRLGNVTTLGSITQYLVDKQSDRFNVSFWQTPDANAALGKPHLLIRQQIVNFTGISDTMLFPQEWFMYLRWALADDISVGQPITIQQTCATKCEFYYKILSDWDVEDGPVRLEVDSRCGVDGRFS